MQSMNISRSNYKLGKVPEGAWHMIGFKKNHFLCLIFIVNLTGFGITIKPTTESVYENVYRAKEGKSIQNGGALSHGLGSESE